METRNCQNCKTDFAIEPDDFSFYEKVKVPPPTFCPKCRSQRRLSWRNNISLYNRTCGLCEKSVVTLYAPDSGITVYCNKCWWSDKWDPKSYAMDYDFTKPFFTQYKELVQKIPHMAIVNDNGTASVGCEYTHDCWFAKNCYMLFSGWRMENAMYSFLITNGKDIVDCLNLYEPSDFVYECISVEKCYQVKYAEFCISCVDSQFIYDCRACSNVFMCAGLRNKKYSFKNQEYSKEEYEKILAGYKLDTFEGMERATKEFKEFLLSYPRKYAYITQSQNVVGDFITNSKNIKNGYGMHNAENCRYYDYGTGPKDSQDITMSGELSECYECIVADHSQLNLFGIFSVKNQDVRYCQHCHSSKHLFACSQLRSSEYCILNKQYSKEEYAEMVAKIIEQMNTMPYVDGNGCEYRYGEFYPSELSVFGYNETVAQVEFPLTRDEASAKGFKWQDHLQMTVGRETITSKEIPESIDSVPDTFINEILACIECSRNYKLIPNELVFYKKMKIPVPRRCFHCRHMARIARRNPLELWHRSCMCTKANHDHSEKCVNEFETSYSPDRPEIVYCESCYQKETV